MQIVQPSAPARPARGASFSQVSMDLADADVLDGFYREQTGTETRFLQLAPGAAELHTCSLDLGALRILTVSGDGRHLWTDHMLSKEWRFAMLLSAEGRPRLGSCDISASTGHLLRPGDAAELLTGGRYRTLEVSFSAELADRLDWVCRPGQMADIGAGTAIRLARAAGAALRSCRSPGKARDWQAIFADLMGQALAPWRGARSSPDPQGASSARAALARKAHRLLRDDVDGHLTSVEELTRALRVSRRSLFAAFQSEYGVGPRRFREFVRLNALRASLRRASPETASVTALAGQHGFTELGRLGGQYRSLFGELPRETLRRRRSESRI